MQNNNTEVNIFNVYILSNRQIRIEYTYTKPCISTKVGAVSCTRMQDKYGINCSSQCMCLVLTGVMIITFVAMICGYWSQFNI